MSQCCSAQSFYLRRRIGPRRWRKLHSLIVVAWLMSAAHALGSGSDGQKLWLEAIVVAPVIPIVYLLLIRVLGATSEPRSSRPARERRDRSEHQTGSAHGYPPEPPMGHQLSLAPDTY